MGRYTRAWIRTFTVVALACLSAALPSPASADAAATEELRRASIAWMQAIEAKDGPALQAFLAPEFRLLAPGDAEVTPRDEWLKNAIARDWSRFRYQSLVPVVDGDHAIVHSRLFFHVAPIPIELDAGIVDTWVRRDGRWQVTARYLGESQASGRIRFISGIVAGLALWGLWALSRRLRRRLGRA